MTFYYCTFDKEREEGGGRREEGGGRREEGGGRREEGGGRREEGGGRREEGGGRREGDELRQAYVDMGEGRREEGGGRREKGGSYLKTMRKGSLSEVTGCPPFTLLPPPSLASWHT